LSQSPQQTQAKPKSQTGNVVAGIILIAILAVGAIVFLQLQANSAAKTPQAVTVCGNVTSSNTLTQGYPYRLDFKGSLTTSSATVVPAGQSTACGSDMYTVDLTNQSQYNVTLYPGPFSCGRLYLTATSSSYNYNVACS